MKRAIAITFLAPLLLSGTLITLPVSAAAGSPLAQDQGAGGALASKIATGAARIHQLTEQLDQARGQINATSAQLTAATRQHDQTMSAIGADQALLHVQAVTAYMHGPSTYQVAASVDLTVGRAYLKVATGNLTETTDRLRVLATNLRRSQSTLRAAQKASTDAVAAAEHARDQALIIAGQEQAQLDRIQAQAASQVALKASQPANSPVAAPAAPAASAPQGLPVNNGLVAVVKAVAAVASVVTKSPPTTVPVHTTAATGGGASGVWQSLRLCESGGNYASNTGNGYFGAYQFSQATWSALGYPGTPDQAPPAMQDQAAAQLQARSGWGQWPACSAALGLR